MKRELAIEFSRVTEAAALAGYKWLGRGDKNLADGAAVEAMRYVLNQIEIDGEIVIGEGEIDEAPMLYIGEKVGCGGDGVDIAVDPIDGTRMTAMGQNNAVAVLAAGDKGSFLKAPDMYMEKMIVGPRAKGVIDLNRPLAENIQAVARALDGDMQGRLLPRHKVKGDTPENRELGEQEIARCQQMGIDVETVLTLRDMAKTDNVIISVTGITKGDLLEGITSDGLLATTETLLIRGRSRTIRRIHSTHYLQRKDAQIQKIIF